METPVEYNAGKKREERIVILTTNSKENSCHCVLEEGCHVSDSCALCNVGMPRTEAIERMAKALYLFNREDEWYKEHADMYSKYMNKIAEAALNALLGE